MFDREFLEETIDGVVRPEPAKVPLAGRLWLDFINMSETTAAAWCILMAIVGTLALKGIA